MHAMLYYSIKIPIPTYSILPKMAASRAGTAGCCRQHGGPSRKTLTAGAREPNASSTISDDACEAVDCCVIGVSRSPMSREGGDKRVGDDMHIYEINPREKIEKKMFQVFPQRINLS